MAVAWFLDATHVAKCKKVWQPRLSHQPNKLTHFYSIVTACDTTLFDRQLNILLGINTAYSASF